MPEKSLQQMMPDAWPVFFHRRGPRPLQAEAMPVILHGKSILLSGPTASGKTEAAVTPLFQRHISFHRRKLSVIYIAPTKALVNDLFYRLDQYLGIKSKNFVRRYTGDHHEFSVPEDAFVLLVTPEALDSLQLMNPEKLTSVRAVVIDEIHLLHGNARGQQLRHVLSRIEQNCHPPMHPRDCFQRIGMTATLQDIDNVGKLWLGDDFASITRGEARQIETTFLQVKIDRSEQKANCAAGSIADWLSKTGTRKILVFGNSRNSTHALAASLYKGLRDSRWPVHWHSGILSKVERERVEEAMKGDCFGVCVATSTLEVGIDIGDIDAVILIEPPITVGAFLQRIGRGNRKTDKCQVVMISSSDQEKRLFLALHHCAVSGVLDDVHEYDRQSVRFQQVLSFAWRGVVKDSSPLTMQNLTERVCDNNHRKVALDMLSTGVLQDVGAALIPSDNLMEQCERRNIHSTIASNGKTQMMDITSGEVLISASGHHSGKGTIFVGGKIKKVIESHVGNVELGPARGNHHPLITLPAMRGRRGLNRNVVWALAELAGENPAVWTVERDSLLTWGGYKYNQLISLLLGRSRRAEKIMYDSYGLRGSYDLFKVSPQAIMNMATEAEKEQNTSTQEALSFCDKNKFFKYLSNNMQREEAMNSIPFSGFLKWLEQCRMETR